MNFTAKSRYALKIMMDLADTNLAGKQQRQQIATRQGLSIDFMDHIMAKLRRSHLVTSYRGRGGGFRLQRPANDISLWDIFAAVEDQLRPVKCLEEQGACAIEAECISADAWGEVFGHIKHQLSSRTLEQMVTRWQQRKPHQAAQLTNSTSAPHPSTRLTTETSPKINLEAPIGKQPALGCKGPLRRQSAPTGSIPSP